MQLTIYIVIMLKSDCEYQSGVPFTHVKLLKVAGQMLLVYPKGTI